MLELALGGYLQKPRLITNLSPGAGYILRHRPGRQLSQKAKNQAVSQPGCNRFPTLVYGSNKINKLQRLIAGLSPGAGYTLRDRLQRQLSQKNIKINYLPQEAGTNSDLNQKG